MKQNTKKTQGFIAIVSLLIVTTIAMFFAIGMLIDGVRNASLSLSSIYYENSRANMSVCLEDTLLRMRREEKFEHNLNYIIEDNNSCATTIEWFAAQQIAPGVVERLANLDITGISHGFVRNFRYELRVDRHDVYYSDGSFEYFNIIDIISETELTT